MRWEQAVTYKAGDQVRSTRAVGGAVFNHVQSGDKGRVVRVEKPLLGGEDKLTVEFGNGYTEQVRASDVERRGWLD